ncbi:MAG: metal-dependent transcriptional regulator [Saprospiraceae bacterium]|nr:metal-dependent transcriptional regulator [Saprospiraceae bacterium]
MPTKLSTAEENYLKAIYKQAEKGGAPVNTNAIARELSTAAASVSDMLRKLSAKGLIAYQKYYGATLLDEGNRIATKLIRRHRLWESFLVATLSFGWEEVHDLAEELEHIDSDLLIDRLDQFLGYPKFDPHGDPIPDRQGRYTLRVQHLLSEMPIQQHLTVVGVSNHDPEFLHLLKDLNIQLGTRLDIVQKFEFDDSLKVLIEEHTSVIISNRISSQLYVRPA